jgi:subtilisin family serine protease
MKNWFVISLSVLLFWVVSMPLSAQPTAVDAYQKADPFLQMAIKKSPAVYLQEKGGPASVEKIRLIVKADASSLQDIRALGADIHTSVGRFHTIQIPKGKLGRLANVMGLQKMFLGQPVVPTDAQAIQHVNAHLVHQGAEGLPRAYSGKDVVIGVIDTGIDFFHEDFRDPEDPAKSRIAYIWDQKMDEGAGQSPKKFRYGREWTRADIEAELSTSSPQLVSHLDTHKIWGGHGTHVMGVAGGNKGLAPGADLIMVASNLSTGDIIDGVRYIMDKAEEMGKPCVINMSFGGVLNPHDGTDILSVILDNMLEGTQGFVICAAAGNEGSDLSHWGGFELTEEPVVMYGTGITNLGMFFRISKEYKKDISISIGVDSADFDPLKGNLLVAHKSLGQTEWMTIQELEERSSGEPLGVFDHSSGERAGTIYVSTQEELDHFSVLLRIEDGIESIYSWEDHLDKVDLYRIMVKGKGSFDSWISSFFPIILGEPDKNGFPLTNFQKPDNEYGITSPADAFNVISVGAYTNRDSWTNIDNKQFGVDQPVGSLANFSSQGPTYDQRVKPDITAPGKIMISAVPTQLAHPDYELVDDSPRAIKSGTSFSAPVAAGSVALLLEHNPSLSYQEIKDLLVNTAIVDKDVLSHGPQPNNSFGAGKLNVYDALWATIELTNTQEVEASPDIFDIQVFPNPASEMLNLTYTLPNSGNIQIQLFNAVGQSLLKEEGFFPKGRHSMQLDVREWSSGLYMARITDGRATTSKVFVRK